MPQVRTACFAKAILSDNEELSDEAIARKIELDGGGLEIVECDKQRPVLSHSTIETGASGQHK